MSRIFVEYQPHYVVVHGVLEKRADFDRMIAALQANATMFYPDPPPDPEPGEYIEGAVPPPSAEACLICKKAPRRDGYSYCAACVAEVEAAGSASGVQP